MRPRTLKGKEDFRLHGLQFSLGDKPVLLSLPAFVWTYGLFWFGNIPDRIPRASLDTEAVFHHPFFRARKMSLAGRLSVFLHRRDRWPHARARID